MARTGRPKTKKPIFTKWGRKFMTFRNGQHIDENGITEKLECEADSDMYRSFMVYRENCKKAGFTPKLDLFHSMYERKIEFDNLTIFTEWYEDNNYSDARYFEDPFADIDYFPTKDAREMNTKWQEHKTDWLLNENGLSDVDILKKKNLIIKEFAQDRYLNRACKMAGVYVSLFTAWYRNDMWFREQIDLIRFQLVWSAEKFYIDAFESEELDMKTKLQMAMYITSNMGKNIGWGTQQQLVQNLVPPEYRTVINISVEDDTDSTN